jgi:lysophospholipase L1-like esterase
MEYDPAWLPYPMLIENALREANPLRKVEVIIMAVPGYTSHQGLAWLRRDIDKLQPNVLVVSFGWNDVSLSDAADHDKIKTDTYAVTVRWLIDHSQAFAHATRWFRALKKSSPGMTTKLVPRVSELVYLDNIRSIIQLAQARGAEVVVLGAPYRDRITNPPEAVLMGRYRAALKARMLHDNVPYLEILELTEAAYPSNEGWFGELIHPNHLGHRLIASELLKFFQERHTLADLNIPAIIP